MRGKREKHLANTPSDKGNYSRVTSCGLLLEENLVVDHKHKVTCNNCKRTKYYKAL